MTDRVLTLSIEVPGTVEEVWEAIATGPGITSWFVPHEVEERAGGAVAMDFGTFGQETATVRVWEPPHRVVFTGPDTDRGPGLAYEWRVESAGGGTCVVRLVNSGFGPGDDWDADFAGMSSGWRIFLANLRLQLTHFRGQRAQAITPTVTAPGPRDAAWRRLCDALGVPADLATGDRLETSGARVPALTARVADVLADDHMRAALLLADAPSPGTGFLAAEGSGEDIMLSVYLYRYGQDGPAEDPWTPWLQEQFPAPTPAASPA